MPDAGLADALAAHLRRLYDDEGARRALAGLLDLCDRWTSHDRTRPLDQRDVWLIAYADHVHDPPRRPLQALAEVLDGELADVVDGVHLLPFYPWSSDDGFAVTDHLAVDAAVGTWADIEAIADGRRLMVDAVVNHVSASHPWVRRWLDGDLDGWVLVVGEGFDTTAVVRPRTSPLLTAFEAADGSLRCAWTTFGPDQVDLDYRTPDVLVAMTEVLLRYADHGAGVIRLDAVGFLWKAPGTTCIHLPQTHEVIRLWRTLLDRCAPGTLLITETNVPHDENIGYFGDGADEAHLVYQFPLAPLVLSAYASGDAADLTAWAASLAQPTPGTAFFNFLGCHDGIGVRPVEGLLSATQVEVLCDLARTAGGGVSHRTAGDGTPVPYELNTTYIDALAAVADDELAVDRIVGAHAILLALQGVPGLWAGALLGVRNDRALVERTGRSRSINRARVRLSDLRASLGDPDGFAARVHAAVTALVRLRRSHEAFAPDSPQQVLPTPPWLFGLVRGRPGRRAIVLVNVAGRTGTVRLDELLGDGCWVDALAGGRAVEGRIQVGPHGVAWLVEHVHRRVGGGRVP